MVSCELLDFAAVGEDREWTARVFGIRNNSKEEKEKRQKISYYYVISCEKAVWGADAESEGERGGWEYIMEKLYQHRDEVALNYLHISVWINGCDKFHEAYVWKIIIIWINVDTYRVRGNSKSIRKAKNRVDRSERNNIQTLGDNSTPNSCNYSARYLRMSSSTTTFTNERISRNFFFQIVIATQTIIFNSAKKKEEISMWKVGRRTRLFFLSLGFHSSASD